VLLQLLTEVTKVECVVRLINDYFINHTKFPQLNRNSSTFMTTNTGVHQSAILSPFFFSLYVSHIPIPNSFVQGKCADDIHMDCPNLCSQSLFSQHINEILPRTDGFHSQPWGWNQYLYRYLLFISTWPQTFFLIYSTLLLQLFATLRRNTTDF